ncbi:GNAT family N-acetyltransferase [Haploplasma axanthum]|uniref:Predicted acetyltransferase involved in intracellular survival and related acetyltransferases n=1 Tax=Haploplasma axanthum TaxID=29552 RepID=A0A449BFL9_HAPAX|nr:GNAT family N-acetyltransferase [Haploplasma axanthum]VEU81243.1 Predicted acetyltransferase involved in intracellular survival and related acetyltransferases [Haploplasma axanthum]
MAIRHSLKMKKVTIEDLDQYNELLRYVFQVTNRDLTQTGWEEAEIIKDKSPALEKANVIGWFDQDKLVSQIAVYDFNVRIYGKTFKMAGVTGVGTFPEYANKGLMQKLIYQSLVEMKEKDQTIAYLFPYSIPYYRKKGWELISNKISYEISDYQLPKYHKVSGDVVRVDPEGDEVKEAYLIFAMKTHGALLRDDIAWSEYFRWDRPDIMAAVYYSEKEKLEGALIYYIDEEIFYIKEMHFLNEDARTALWNFVSAHFSMISKVKGDTYTDELLSFLLEDADIKESISPYFMGRIVDVVGFIKQYPFKADTHDRKWIFNLSDPLLEWNSGTFELFISKDGKGEINRVQKKVEDSIDIGSLTTMLLGYKRPEYLKQIRRINASDETIDMLEDAIEQQAPYFSDYF